MNGLSKTKLISYLAAIFVAGGITGATVAVTATKKLMAEPPRTEHMEAHYLKERFQSKLGLTPEQEKVIEPILEKMSKDLKSIRGETTKRVSAIMKNSCDQIGKELTPEQRQRLEEMKKDRPENAHRRFKPPWDSPRKSNSPPKDL
jgi:Spy/CpxP family protein refolding chaperone